ncbi:MAG: Uma2 family endonuclease [Pirellulales bacterium]
MSTATRITTADELFRMPDNAYRLELVEGEIRQMSPGGGAHGYVGIELASRLADYVRCNNLGCVIGAETGYLIQRDPDTVLAPDVSFIRKEKLAVTGIPETFYPEAPSLVVEVVSPNDTAEEVDDKLRRWLAAGVELGWVVYPKGRSVTVYRGLDDIRVLTESDTLDGGSVIPGFTCRVGDLFAALGPK